MYNTQMYIVARVCLLLLQGRQLTVMLQVAFDDEEEEEDNKGQRNPTSPKKLFS
jgi:hypothetical protein